MLARKGLANELERKLSSSEWSIVSYYIFMAEDYNKREDDSGMRSALRDAASVAISKVEMNAANNINYYVPYF